MTRPIGEVIRTDAENRMLSAKWEAIVVKIEADLEPLWGGPLDEAHALKMQNLLDGIWDRDEPRMPSWMREHFRSPVVHLEHGEGSRLPATNIYLEFPKPIIRANGRRVHA